VAQAVEAKGYKMDTVATRIDRRLMDRLISWTGALMAFALVALGAAAIYGGSFALDNVRDRLEPQNITFPPAEAMSDHDREIGIDKFAGQKVDTGTEAEAFSSYIGGHLTDVNDGKTYSETSSESRAYAAEVGEDPTAAEAATMGELSGKVETLFRGETLRAILLNAYGWWVVGSITLYVGYGAVAIGILLALFAFFGFRHAKKIAQS
jgi:hypothetical protein